MKTIYKDSIPSMAIILLILSIGIWSFSKRIGIGGFEIVVFLPELILVPFVFIGIPLLFSSRKDIDLKYFLLPLGILTFMLISSIFSIAPMASFKEGLRVGEMFIAFIFVSNLVKRIGWVKWILITILILGVSYGLWGMKGLANLKDLGNGVSTHFFVNPNQIAMYLDLSFPLSVAFLFYSRNVRWKILCAFCILVIGLGLSLTLSRSSWVSNSCALVFLLLTLFHQKNGNKFFMHILKGTYSLSFIGMTILFFCLLFLVYFAPGVTEILLKRAESGVMSVFSARFYGFATGYRIIEDFPLLGIGGGIFTRVAPYYFPPYTPKDIQDFFVTVHFHNHYLMVAVEYGLLTLLTFLLFLYSVGKDILSSLLVMKDEGYWLLAGTGGSVLSWAVHNIMDAGIPFIGMQWGILLGLGVAMTKMNIREVNLN